MAQGDIIKIMRQNGNGSQLVGMNKNQVGLNNVDNTADVDKPISTAQNDRFSSVEAIANAAAPQATTYTKTEVAGSIGRINSPLLNLPLKNSLDYETGNGQITFSRSTNATYIDRYGVLKYAEVDEPRFEKEGLLIEGVSTNFLSNSSNMSDTTNEWGTRNAACTSTDSGLPALGGELGNWFEIASDGSEDYTYLYSLTNTTLNNESVSTSVFIKQKDLDTCRITLYDVNDGNIGFISYKFSTDTLTVSAYSGETAKRELFSDGAVKITLSRGDATASDNLRLLLHPYDPSVGTNVTGSTYFAFPQVEKLPFASSYIPTTDSVATRGKDRLLVTRANNIPNIEQCEGLSVSLEVDLLGTGIGNQWYWGLYVDTYNKVGGHFSNGGNMYIDSGSNGNSSYDRGGLYDGKPVKIINVITSNSIECVVDGISNGSSTYQGQLTNDGNSHFNYIRIGSYNPVTSGSMYGHIKDFRIYDVALTPTEVALLGGKQ